MGAIAVGRRAGLLADAQVDRLAGRGRETYGLRATALVRAVAQRLAADASDDGRRGRPHWPGRRDAPASGSGRTRTTHTPFPQPSPPAAAQCAAPRPCGVLERPPYAAGRAARPAAARTDRIRCARAGGGGASRMATRSLRRPAGRRRRSSRATGRPHGRLALISMAVSETGGRPGSRHGPRPPLPHIERPADGTETVRRSRRMGGSAMDSADTETLSIGGRQRATEHCEVLRGTDCPPQHERGRSGRHATLAASGIQYEQ